MSLASDKTTVQQAPPRPPAPPRWSGRNGYSFFVQLLKLTLPVTALVLAGLIVFWQQIMPSPRLLSADFSDLSPEMAKSLLMTGPRYDGVDAKGLPYSLTANAAQQHEDDENIIFLARPTADLTLEGGAWAALSADQGVFDRSTELLLLQGNVNFFHDRGFELRTSKAVLDLKAAIARGDQAVEGQGPSGMIEAEGFEFRQEGGIMMFTGQSHLTVLPEPGSSPTDGTQPKETPLPQLDLPGQPKESAS